MSGRCARILRMSLFGGLLSPLGWVLRAGMVLAAFTVFHVLGWRDDMRIISGTSLPASAADAVVIRGLLYGASYFAAVVLCPILILAAGIPALLLRVSCRREVQPTVTATHPALPPTSQSA
jgi:hypothetical protein